MKARSELIPETGIREFEGIFTTLWTEIALPQQLNVRAPNGVIVYILLGSV